MVTTEWAGSEAGQNEAVRGVCGAISSHREPAALFRALGDELQKAVRFDYLGLILYDELLNKIEIAVLHVVNGPGVAVPADLRPEDTITWWVYHNQKPEGNSSPSEETRFPAVRELYKRDAV